MILTVRRALTLECLAEAKLVAGQRGLEREIKFVNIMEVPEVVRWMKGGELLLTSGYALPAEPEARQKLVRSMDQKGIAALGIKLGPHLQEVPGEVVAEANLVGLPLLELPKDQPYMEIMVPITEELLNTQVARLKRYETIHNRLLGVLLAGGGLAELCGVLQQIVHNPVLILNRNGSCPACCFGEAWPVPEDRHRILQELKEASPRWLHLPPNRVHRLEILLDGQPHSLGLVLIKVNDQVDGALVVLEQGHPLGEQGLRSVEYAGPVAALVFAKEKAVLEARRQLQGDFLEELVHNTFNDEELMKKRGQFLGFTLEAPLAVFVMNLAGDGFYGRQAEKERQLLKEFLRQRIHQAFPSEEQVMLQVKSSSVTGVAKITGGRNLPSLVQALQEAKEAAGQKGFKDRLIVGIGRPYEGVRLVAKSYQEALTAVKVAPLLDGGRRVCYFGELGPYRFLSELKGSEDMESFHREMVGAIKMYDEQNNANLLETLEVYFAKDGNLKNTAAALHLHKNSVSYRIKKIEELTGLDLGNPEDRFNLQLGLKLDKIV